MIEIHWVWLLVIFIISLVLGISISLHMDDTDDHNDWIDWI